MIEIVDGLTRVSAGTNEIPWVTGIARAPTGVRLTVEFERNAALPPDSVVRVRYEFESGTLREIVGLAQPIRTVVRWGREVVYHYRLSQWITPAALLQVAAVNVRYRTEGLETRSQHSA